MLHWISHLHQWRAWTTKRDAFHSFEKNGYVPEKIFPKSFLIKSSKRGDCNTILLKWVKKISKFRPQKIQKFDKSSEPAELDRRRDACNSAKWPQYNPFEMGEKNFKIFLPNIQKIDLFGPKMAKNDQKIGNFSKYFLVGIDLERFKTCFKTKILILKIFSRWNFFLGYSC